MTNSPDAPAPTATKAAVVPFNAVEKQGALCVLGVAALQEIRHTAVKCGVLAALALLSVAVHKHRDTSSVQVNAPSSMTVGGVAAVADDAQTASQPRAAAVVDVPQREEAELPDAEAANKQESPSAMSATRVVEDCTDLGDMDEL